MWKKYVPRTVEGQTVEEQSLEILNSKESTKKILKDAEVFESNASMDVNQKVRALYHQLEFSGRTPKDVVLAKEHVRKTLFTRHGTRNEDKTADTDSANLVRDDTFYETKICEIEGTVYTIVGRVARIQINANGMRTLVESNNRANKRMGRVRD